MTGVDWLAADMVEATSVVDLVTGVAEETGVTGLIGVSEEAGATSVVDLVTRVAEETGVTGLIGACLLYTSRCV